MATFNGTSGNDTLTGTTAADLLNGFAGDDLLFGKGRADTLDGGDGTDTLRGGGGGDLYLVSGASADVIEDNGGFDTVIATNTGIYTLASGLDVLILRGDEVVNVGPSNVLHGIGNDLDNTLINERTGFQSVALTGGGGNDVMFGGDERDTFLFGDNHGDDFVDGGGDEDTLSFTQMDASLFIDFNDGFASSDAGTVSFENIETAWGTVHGDRFIGNRAANSMFAGGGNDILNGGGGGDSLQGGSDEDRLLGGGGPDGLLGGDGDDFLDGNAGRDAIIGGAGNDRVIWDPNDALVSGGDGRNTLKLRPDSDLDLVDFPDENISEFEVIDMTAAGRNHLVVTEADVLDLGGSSTVFVHGTGVDSINIVGDFTDVGFNPDDGWHYYRLGERHLFLGVDPDITNVT